MAFVLEKNKTREVLQWTKKRGRLEQELTCYRVVLRVMQDGRGKYGIKHRKNVRLLIRVACELLDLDPKNLPPLDTATLPYKQVRIMALFGPSFGFLAGFAASQPADFYFDDRTGEPYFSKSLIVREVRALAKWAAERGLNPHNLEKPSFHNCGVF